MSSSDKVDVIAVRLSDLIINESVDAWLRSYNKAFGAAPIDLVGTDRERELWRMIELLESGMPQ